MQEVRTERRKHKFRKEKFDIFKKQKRRMQQNFQFCHKIKKKCSRITDVDDTGKSA